MRRAAAAADVVCALGVATAVELGLRLRPLPSIARRCGVRLDLAAPPASAMAAVLPARVRRQMRAVDRAMSHWPFGDTCLRRCLVLGQRLRRYDPVLRIGVALDREDTFRAHSWLEVLGWSLDPESARYTAFGSPAAGAPR